jgi:hypothetical protein
MGWGVVVAYFALRPVSQERMRKGYAREWMWWLYRLARPFATREEWLLYSEGQVQFWSRRRRLFFAPFLVVGFAFCIWIVAQGP